jgi:glycosyltransferase involved in cell wall biosynthesis
MDRPLLSVHIITYNQASYIADTLEGALRQETDFGVEILVGDDCSTDGTREIVLDYQRRYPRRLRVITSERNVGIHENARRVAEACRGKYVAFCEGDDYWTDPHKLQKQVDFLETHPEYSLCCHDVDIIFDGVPETARTDRYLAFAGDTFTFEDAVRGHFIPTLSIVCWREPVVRVPDWYRECISGDIPMELLLLDRGLGYYLHERLGTKRDNPGSVSLNPARAAVATESFLRMYQHLDSYLAGRHREVLHWKIARVSLKLARQNLDAGRHIPFLRYLAKSLRYDRKAIYEAATKRLRLVWRGNGQPRPHGAESLPRQTPPVGPGEEGRQVDAQSLSET